MILFPAIDLKDGHCVRLEQGDMQRATVFGTDPGAQARAEAEKVETVCVLGHGSRLFRASGTTSYPNRPE